MKSADAYRNPDLTYAEALRVITMNLVHNCNRALHDLEIAKDIALDCEQTELLKYVRETGEMLSIVIDRMNILYDEI